MPTKTKRKTVTGTYDGVRKWFKGKTYKAAEERKAQFEAQIIAEERNKLYLQTRITLNDFYESWYNTMLLRCKVNTVANYDLYYQKHIASAFGNMYLDDITSSSIEAWLIEKKKTLSPRSCNYTRTIFGSILKKAKQEKIINENPMDNVPKLKEQKKIAYVPTLAEFQKLLASISIEDIQFKRILWVLVATGLRRSEVLGLDINAIDLKHNVIAIVQTVVPLNHQPLLERTTKNDTSMREISIDQNTAKILQEQMQYTNQSRKRNPKYTNKGLLFADLNGFPINPEYFTHKFAKYTHKLNMKEFTPHKLRHLHATLLLEAGVAMKVVQERLGHSSIIQTMDTYSHVTNRLSKVAADSIKEILEK